MSRPNTYLQELERLTGRGMTKHVVSRIASSIVGTGEEQAQAFLADNLIEMFVVGDRYGNTESLWEQPEYDRCDRVLVHLVEGRVVSFVVG